MTTPTNPSELFTPFLPTTTIFPDDPERIPSYLTDKFASYADVINDKKIGAYTESSENFNGNKFIYITPSVVRNGYQSMTYITSFTNGLTIPNPVSNINSQWVISKVWGSASKPCSAVGAGDGDYFSFMAMGDSRISFTMSDTTITITTDGSRSGYSGFIFLEFIRNGF